MESSCYDLREFNNLRINVELTYINIHSILKQLNNDNDNNNNNNNNNTSACYIRLLTITH